MTADLLATYLLHSTVVLGLTLALLRLTWLRSAALRDPLLKVALLAPLMTAPLSVLGGLPALPGLSLTQTLQTQTPPIQTPPTQTRPPGPAALPVSLVQPLRLAAPPAAPDWAAALLLLSAAVTVLRFGLAWRSLTRHQLGRVSDPALAAHMNVLARCGPPVRLYWTDLGMPCAAGLGRVLLPRTIRQQLTAAGLKAVLAHEYAHLRRRDPLWTTLLSALAQLLWCQPLNGLALRHWQQAAEERCDAWAGKQTSPVTLAQALLDLARLRLPHPLPLLISAVSQPPLTRRVTALLTPEKTMPRPLFLLALLPALFGTLTPSLALGGTSPQIIVLDAGHGGDNPGAVGYAREATVNLQIARLVRDRLLARGVQVIMTREGDTSLSVEARVRQAASPATAFVSIHADVSDDSRLRGTETFVAATEGTPRDLRLARALAGRIGVAVAAHTGAVNLGVHAVQAPAYYVLRKAQIPAVMVSVGYVSHAQEGRALATAAYQARIADGVAQALLTSAH